MLFRHSGEHVVGLRPPQAVIMLSGSGTSMAAQMVPPGVALQTSDVLCHFSLEALIGQVGVIFIVAVGTNFCR